MVIFKTLKYCIFAETTWSKGKVTWNKMHYFQVLGEGGGQFYRTHFDLRLSAASLSLSCIRWAPNSTMLEDSNQTNKLVIPISHYSMWRCTTKKSTFLILRCFISNDAFWSLDFQEILIFSKIVYIAWYLLSRCSNTSSSNWSHCRKLYLYRCCVIDFRQVKTQIFRYQFLVSPGRYKRGFMFF